MGGIPYSTYKNMLYKLDKSRSALAEAQLTQQHCHSADDDPMFRRIFYAWKLHHGISMWRQLLCGELNDNLSIRSHFHHSSYEAAIETVSCCIQI